MTYVWTPRPGCSGPEMHKCRASVAHGRGFARYSQCSRLAVLWEPGGNTDGMAVGWCRLHAPSAVAARHRARWEKEDAVAQATAARLRAAQRRENLASAALDFLRALADDTTPRIVTPNDAKRFFREHGE